MSWAGETPERRKTRTAMATPSPCREAFEQGSTGGRSALFAEPAYQRGRRPRHAVQRSGHAARRPRGTRHRRRRQPGHGLADRLHRLRARSYGPRFSRVAPAARPHRGCAGGRRQAGRRPRHRLRRPAALPAAAFGRDPGHHRPGHTGARPRPQLRRRSHSARTRLRRAPSGSDSSLTEPPATTTSPASAPRPVTSLPPSPRRRPADRPASSPPTVRSRGGSRVRRRGVRRGTRLVRAAPVRAGWRIS